MISVSTPRFRSTLVGQEEFWLRWPDECCIAVIRKGEQVPCDKVAVAVVAPTDGDSWFAVCKRHTRGKNVVPLKMLIEKLIGVGSDR